ncbi:MAG TPA: hypothetical protein PLM33_00910 [Acidobacteriota bacterium]|nr:hypothetical protein [Acidobacteriota bacterium]HRR25887.1 hypothetical protein [Acidobacteriota bacterium]HRR55679.1 hypothetical protein [Acidobacteriota bacterium]HRV06948.1 hypothetical protein [Acidobacteriota bacterium]
MVRGRLRPLGRRSARWLFWGVLIGAGCSSYTGEPPAGEPVDLESWRTFKPFVLEDLEGNPRALQDLLGRVTLVAFFFPT